MKDLVNKIFRKRYKIIEYKHHLGGKRFLVLQRDAFDRNWGAVILDGERADMPSYEAAVKVIKLENSKQGFKL